MKEGSFCPVTRTMSVIGGNRKPIITQKELCYDRQALTKEDYRPARDMGMGR